VGPGRPQMSRVPLLMLSVLGAVLCACAFPSPRQGAPEPSDRPPLDFYVEQVKSTSKLSPAAEIHIVNHWGDIRVRSGDPSGGIVIDAAVQRIGEPFPARPELAVTENSDSFELVVRYPGASMEPRSGRVDLAVYVPDGLKVSLETLDGKVEAKKTAVDLKARTRSGDVLFINQGEADVETESGEIIARPTAPGWATLKLYSATGRIMAFLPVGPGLEVVARGTTDIRSHWPLVRDGEHHLLLLGGNHRDRDQALITSGRSIELLEVVLEPGASEQ